MEDSNTRAVRINKYLADRGLASRREADELIAAGKVWVNGKQASIGQKVGPSDKVEMRGAAKTYHYWAYHKPIGEATEEIKLERGAFTLGRLDKESHGLILITDDRRLTGRLLDPEFGHEREYVVEVDKHLSPSFARIIGQGVKIEDEVARPAKVEIIGDKTFKIILTEGKRHEIRRMCAALGFQVVDLLRTRIMHLRLGQIRPGSQRELRPDERAKLLAALGLT